MAWRFHDPLPQSRLFTEFQCSLVLHFGTEFRFEQYVNPYVINPAILIPIVQKPSPFINYAYRWNPPDFLPRIFKARKQNNISFQISLFFQAIFLVFHKAMPSFFCGKSIRIHNFSPSIRRSIISGFRHKKNPRNT